MSIRFVENLQKEELDEFVVNHPFSHYMKTYEYGIYFSKLEKYYVSYVGLKNDEDKLIASAVVFKKKEIYSKNYLYIPQGMCVDYNNLDLLSTFVDELVKYAKKEKASFIKINPNVERCHRDILGNLIDDGFNNEYVTDFLVSKGFKHKGYGYAYDGSWINRYTLKIDLSADIDTIVSRFTKSKQNVLKKHKEMGISTRVGSYDELKYIVEFEKDLAMQKGFKPHKVSFFEDLYNELKDFAHFYITEIDLNKRIEFLTDEINSNKYKKDPEAKKAKEKELDEAIKLKNEYGDKPKLACGFFVKFGTNSWDLYTYNKKAFFNFKAADNLHQFIIEDMKNMGVIKYDMVGFSGKTNKDDPYYGLYDYKRSFGSDFVEQIGEFDYIIDAKDYKNFCYFNHLYRRARRKINSIIFKGKQ